MIHHVHLACPPHSEQALRFFCVNLLAMVELPKPLALAARGGCWFRHLKGWELHFGVEEDFRPQRKAHPGILCDELETLAKRLEGAGYPVIWDEELPGFGRFYSEDPNGNRLEFLTPARQVAPSP